MKITVTQDMIDAADFMRADSMEPGRPLFELGTCARCPIALAFSLKGLDVRVFPGDMSIEGKSVNNPSSIRERIKKWDEYHGMNPFEFTYDRRGRFYGVRDL